MKIVQDYSKRVSVESIIIGMYLPAIVYYSILSFMPILNWNFFNIIGLGIFILSSTLSVSQFYKIKRSDITQTIYFKLTKNSAVESVVFRPYKSYEEIDEYFEERCGGVYEWNFNNF